MSAYPGMAYAQTRIQSRYGERADAGVWLRLHNIHDLGSYLQTAQQTALHPWVLGLSATLGSDDIELALRQKYRRHVDEVAGWMPTGWQKPLRWIKRLADLPVIQHLIAGGEPHEWMKSDPAISDFVADDPSARLQALRRTGHNKLLESWQNSGSLMSGWLSQWKHMRPDNRLADRGLNALERLLQQHMQQQLEYKVASPADYEAILDQLRSVFRHYAFQPAAACAYLAIIAVDCHRIRGDLMQRLYFHYEPDIAVGLPE